MPLDIRPDHLKIVEEILEKYVPDREVWAFGSRINGTAKETSDLDLVVTGETPLDFQTLGALRDAFSESNIPYKVDVVDWATISETFREIIRKDKVVIQKGSKKEWAEAMFSELCDITRGASPRPINDWTAKNGIPWVKISDASASMSRFIEKTNEHIKKEAQSRSVTVFPGDLILSNSATPGIPMFMEIEACIHDGWLLLRNFRGINKVFAYYLLLHERSALVQQGNGSVFTNLKTEILKKHKILLPPLPEQRAIAHILGTLDDKIELNRRMNETLEAMAQALFKSWFVDFDPVRAKAEGRDTGLPKEIADLFPDGFEESELGEIPRGWEIEPLSKFSEIKGGKQLSKEMIYSSGQIPVFGGAGIMGYTDSFNAEGFVISFGRVGAYCGQFFYQRGKAWINNNASIILFDRNIPGEWLFLVLQALDLEPIKRGAAQPFISNSDLSALNILMPSFKLITIFQKIVFPIFKKLEANLMENKLLFDLREKLLPKLLSGEISVSG